MNATDYRKEHGPVVRYQHAIAAERMGHAEHADVEDVRRRSKRELELEIKSARDGLRALEEIRRHACTWDAESYCGVCGADGRA